MRVLVVEDDMKIASFVAKGLRQAGFAVDHVIDGEEAFRLFQVNPYDVAVVDIMLPKMDGLTLLEKLRERKIKTPVIILSAKGSVDDKILGLQKGGDDYITKPFSFSELLVRIQALIRRSGMAGGGDPTRLKVGDLTMNLLTREVVRGDEKIELQAKEFSVLEYLMRNSGNVLSKTMILEHVWDYHFDPQTNVVDVLIHRLRSKVDKNALKKMIHTIRGVGYVLKES
ncbi:MAG: response regulator transcription factor [Spirochaetota bacterium]